MWSSLFQARDGSAFSFPESCIYGDHRVPMHVDQGLPMMKCDEIGRQHPWKCYDEYHSDQCCDTCKQIRRQDKPSERVVLSVLLSRLTFSVSDGLANSRQKNNERVNFYARTDAASELFFVKLNCIRFRRVFGRKFAWVEFAGKLTPHNVMFTDIISLKRLRGRLRGSIFDVLGDETAKWQPLMSCSRNIMLVSRRSKMVNVRVWLTYPRCQATAQNSIFASWSRGVLKTVMTQLDLTRLISMVADKVWASWSKLPYLSWVELSSGGVNRDWG